MARDLILEPPPFWQRDLRWVQPPALVIERGEAVGFLRFRVSESRGEQARYDPKTSEANHKLGGVGEAVFCWFHGIPWAETIDGYREVPDVAPDIEVRTTRKWSGLKVATDDKASRRVTFVIHPDDSEWWYVSGLWIKAGEAKRRFPKTDRGNFGWPAHFVPREALSKNIAVPGHAYHVFEVEDDGLVCYGGERCRLS